MKEYRSEGGSGGIMDIKHFYIEKGQGEPLVLLHGNGEDSNYFINQIDEFSSNFRVIALDTRGHGQTPRGDSAFTIRQFADDLLVFLDRMNIQKANILGFSDGANIAMCFASKYPERVLKLVLNGGNLDTQGIGMFKHRLKMPMKQQKETQIRVKKQGQKWRCLA